MKPETPEIKNVLDERLAEILLKLKSLRCEHQGYSDLHSLNCSKNGFCERGPANSRIKAAIWICITEIQDAFRYTDKASFLKKGG